MAKHFSARVLSTWRIAVIGSEANQHYRRRLRRRFSNMTCWLCQSETTELATNAKAPTCQNVTCQICVAVTDIDKEINQAVATLRSLLNKRCDLRSEQNRVHSRALMRRLPVEITNYIFGLLVAPLQNEWGQIPRSRRPIWTRRPPVKLVMPTYLASICRSWRDIAWSNPSLWSTMHIAIRTRTSTFDPFSRINFVQNWIQRSRTLPLTLHIVDHEAAGLAEELKGIIDVINRCSDRWHSLSLNIPFELLHAFHRNNFQCRLLKKLRIFGNRSPSGINRSVPLFDSTVSPEKVEICGVFFQSLQISWTKLSSATLGDFDLENVTQLFRQASQMTECRIFSLNNHRNFPSPMPPIIHQRLQTLSLYYGRDQDAAALFLGSLTLPCLQRFHATEMMPLKQLPALVHRSSCPLTRITFELTSDDADWGLFDGLQPLPGMIDLVVTNVEGPSQIDAIKKLLFEGYFPDLRRLTLLLEPFRYLWDKDVIPLLLDRKRLHPDAITKGRPRKILVINQHRVGELVCQSHIESKLRELQLEVSLREDGFEILIPT